MIEPGGVFRFSVVSGHRGWLRLALVLIPLVLLGIAPGGRRAVAQTLSEERAVEVGREALEGAVRFPWYDSEGDQLKRIDVEPPDDLENRHSQWVSQPPTRSMPAWLMKLLEVLVWLGLGLLLGFLVYLMVRAFLARERAAGTGEEAAASVVHGDADRVEALPFQVKRPRAHLLEEARRHYEAGQYGEAIVYLYSYQLIELDKHQVIRLSRGKTNRQYLREIARRPTLSQLLERTMIAFEDVFFGKHRLERRRFESCWNSLDEFHQLLEQAAV